jgi:hypothetical protein
MALKKYYTNKSNLNNKTEINNLIKKTNSILPIFTPDTLINEMEFLQNNLYNINELSVYYSLAKENNFNFGEKIIEWAKKLINLLFKK